MLWFGFTCCFLFSASNTERSDSWSPSTWVPAINVNQNSVGLSSNVIPNKIGGDMEGEDIAQVDSTSPNHVKNRPDEEQGILFRIETDIKYTIINSKPQNDLCTRKIPSVW